MIMTIAKGGRALRIAVETIVIGTILLAGGAVALSNSGGGSWQYYKDITINNMGGDLSDYQVSVKLAGSNFPAHAQTSGADIRFTDARGNELSYWIERWDYSSRTANIWVKVTSIQAESTATVRMYYGNPNALSGSDGNATFDFFDDFEGYSIEDLNGQGGWSGNIVFDVQTSAVYEGTKAIIGTPAGDGHISKSFTPNLLNAKVVWAESENDLFRLGALRVLENTTQIAFAGLDNNEFRDNEGYFGSASPNTWYIFELIIKDNNTHNIKVGTNNLQDRANSANMVSGINKIDLWVSTVSELTYFDYIRVQKYTSPEPTISIGAEQSAHAPSPITSITVSPSTATVLAGNTRTFNAADQNGNPISVIWSVSDETVGTIDQSGVFTALRAGKATVKAVSGGVSGSADVDIIEDFNIAHLTDVHIGSSLSGVLMKDSVKRFTDTLYQIKRENPGLILNTGDIVECDDRDYFTAFYNLLQSMDIPVKSTPGNHDRRRCTQQSDTNITDYNTIVNDNINLNMPPDPINPIGADYAFAFKGYRFIGLDSGADYDPKSLLLNDWTPEGTGLTGTQLAWLNNFDTNTPKIIFMHHPAMNTINDRSVPPGCDPSSSPCLPALPPNEQYGNNDATIAANRPEFIDYSKTHNVQLVLTGHEHKDAIFDKNGAPVDESSSNLPLFIQTRSATRNDNGSNYGYRIIEVKNGMANPKRTTEITRYTRNLATVKSKMSNTNREGWHAFNSENKHTGMRFGGCNGFDREIPESYYTGDYEGSPTEQVLVAYTPVEKWVLKTCLISNTANLISNTANTGNPYDMTLESQTEASTVELDFNNVNLNQDSVATVDGITSNKMNIDLDGDGIIDQMLNPDSISTTPSTPQNNITVIAYNGVGTINLALSSGYFISAASLNASSINGRPSYEFPYGLLAFNISGLSSGQAVDVTLTLPQNLSSAAQYWKYGRTPDNTTPHWYLIPVGSSDGDNVITLRLQDGGAGDDDLTANGIILDAGGPAIPLAGRVTGGGWIRVTQDRKATFSFSGRYSGGAVTPTGHLKYNDNATGLKVHGNITTLSVEKTANSATFGGTAKINGVDGYAYTVTVIDSGEPGKMDTFTINIPAITYTASGTLGRGNIRIHKT